MQTAWAVESASLPLPILTSGLQIEFLSSPSSSWKWMPKVYLDSVNLWMCDPHGKWFRPMIMADTSSDANFCDRPTKRLKRRHCWACKLQPEKPFVLLKHRIELIDSCLRIISPLLLCTPDHPTYRFPVKFLFWCWSGLMQGSLIDSFIRWPKWDACRRYTKLLKHWMRKGVQQSNPYLQTSDHNTTNSQFGHKAFLSHHLRKLTDQGQLLASPQGTYSLPNQHIPWPCREDQCEQTQDLFLHLSYDGQNDVKKKRLQHQQMRGKPIWPLKPRQEDLKWNAGTSVTTRGLTQEC